MKNRRPPARRYAVAGFMYASARSRFAAMRMEFLLFDLGEWLDAGVNKTRRRKKKVGSAPLARRGGSLTRRGKKFSACSSLGGGGSSPDEKVDRGGWMEKKRRDFERKVVEEALSVEDVLLFSSGGDLFGISSLRELQNDCCLFIYLFVRREIGVWVISR